MRRAYWLYGLAALLVMAGVCAGAGVHGHKADRRIRLIIRADDIGSSHAANVACIRSYREGIARSVEVMVCAPWFNEAVTMLNENPGYDVGVHLTLTSEWETIKWGPLTQAPSLVDEQGHFFPMTSQRKDFPPNTGFLQCGWKIDEVERELRAQIELARAKIKNVTHLSAHMGTATCTPELRELVKRLAAEYDLPIETPGVKRTPRWGSGDMEPGQRADALAEMLGKLEPGTYLLVEHPGLDCDEMRAIGHKGYWNVAKHREGVTRAFTSARVKKAIEERGIELISYHDLWEAIGKEN